MEQLRKIGEVLGSIKTLMAFQDDAMINRSQCSLLTDALNLVFDAVSQEIKETLIFFERHTKWEALENPLLELHGIFLNAELYIQQCIETRDNRAIAIFSLIRASDCTDLHLHDILSCLPAVMESIEAAGEISGDDPEQTHRKKLIFSKRYDKDLLNPALFRRELGRRRLLAGNIAGRLAGARNDDRRTLLDRIDDRLVNIVKLSTVKLFPSSTLVASKDYQVRRRLGSGSQFKEIHWMGENFAVRHFFGDINPLTSEILHLCSLSHPNVLSLLCAFSDDDRRECFLLMELMHRSLSSHVKELTGRRRRHPFALPAAVDILLQIARGMEYLHYREIYHGNLSSSSVLVKGIGSHLRVKVCGVGLSSVKNPGGGGALGWSPPEMHGGGAAGYTEKGDVYSFGMVCLEVLTGKSVRAGEEPELLCGLVNQCLEGDPLQRPKFSAICRILRWVKRWVLVNPGKAVAPPVDYLEIDRALSRRFPEWGSSPESDHIPFQMFAYRVLERNFETGSGDAGEYKLSGDENPIKSSSPARASFKPPSLPIGSDPGKKVQRRASLGTVVQKKGAAAPRPQRVLRSPRRRKSSGHASDSEIV